MEYLKNNEIKNIMIDDIMDKLEDYKDTEIYACDIAYTLYEAENADGCIFSYYTRDNEEFIKKYWDDLPEILEELRWNFDCEYFSKILIDMFDNPCKFVLIVCLEVANYILGQCKLLEDNWNDKIILTRKNINILKKQLEEMRG